MSAILDNFRHSIFCCVWYSSFSNVWYR